MKMISDRMIEKTSKMSAFCVLVAAFYTPNLKAEGGACSQSGGAIIFQDTLYGLGTGVLISGLILLTQDDHDRVSQQLATGGLIGAGLGLGFGFYDVSSRNCKGQASAQPGWSMPKLAYSPIENDWSMKLQYSF